MLDQLLQYDTELFLYLNNLGSPSWDGFWLAYTAKTYWIPFYALLLYFMYRQWGKIPFLITVAVVALMILFTDQITNLFKYGFERPRPCHVEALINQMRIVRKGCGGPYGFFSGHAANSMAVAVFAGLMLKNFKYLIYVLVVWAIAMAYSRIYVGVHYPLDVLCGMLFGSLSGFLFYRVNLYFIRLKTNA
ncbi:MAG TPA: phosphatase PAP2 family protein [Flavobacteriaceae bacterium]|nr:phosphatase PAP2 family protein [Flavobacteriaceae bacterium]